MGNWAWLAAIPMFGLLVLVHEFGHFITAKWAGIRVEEFALGFPPRIVGIRKREQGGWEVIWFGGMRNEEDTYGASKQTPFSGTSGGISASGAPASNHTIYSINLIPIGGFVRMPGENGDVHDESGNYDPNSFAAKSAGKRLVVVVSGGTLYVLFVLGVFSNAFRLGRPNFRPRIGTGAPFSPVDNAAI